MATLPELAQYDAGRTIQFGEAGQKRKTLAEIGGFAASGDFKGAQAAAFAGGETEMGLHLKQMNDDDKQKLVSQAASWAYQANNPQAWEAGRKQWMDMGYDIGPFESREALLSQALTIQDRMQQANADRNYNLQARQENRLASAANADGGVGKRSLTPTWLKDKDGNWVPGQLSATGQLIPAETPEGFSAIPPADIAGVKQGAIGDAKAAATARAALPAAEQAVTIAREAIDTLRNNRTGQDETFGNFAGVVPHRWLPTVPGTPKANFSVQLEQASGQAFMQARNMLKGGGQITDYEGRRGEAAYSRMQAAAERGDQAEFLRALDDFEQAVETGYQKLQAAAGGGYSAGPSPVPGQRQPTGGPEDDLDSLLNQYAP